MQNIVQASNKPIIQNDIESNSFLEDELNGQEYENQDDIYVIALAKRIISIDFNNLYESQDELFTSQITKKRIETFLMENNIDIDKSYTLKERVSMVSTIIYNNFEADFSVEGGEFYIFLLNAFSYLINRSSELDYLDNLQATANIFGKQRLPVVIPKLNIKNAAIASTSKENPLITELHKIITIIIKAFNHIAIPNYIQISRAAISNVNNKDKIKIKTIKLNLKKLLMIRVEEQDNFLTMGADESQQLVQQCKKFLPPEYEPWTKINICNIKKRLIMDFFHGSSNIASDYLFILVDSIWLTVSETKRVSLKLFPMAFHKKVPNSSNFLTSNFLSFKKEFLDNL